MKKLLSLILTIVLLISTVPLGAFSFTACAENVTSGTIGDCTWTLDGTVLTISGNGKMGNYFGVSLPWGESITEVIIENGVTSIGSGAFYYCQNLKEVSIANTVETIGYDAFAGCSSLKELVLPEGLKNIEAWAFWQCFGLNSIYIPESVVEISGNPFEGLNELEIYVAEGNEVFFSEGNCLINRSTGVLVHGGKNAVIPQNAGIKVIGEDAFAWDENLKEIVIPYGVERICENAFWSCENVVNVEIPETVNCIHQDALRFLNTQVTVSISKDNKTYHSSGNCIIETDSKTIIVGYSNSTIPTDDSVTAIGRKAFYGSMALTDIYIPDNIVSIGYGAFFECRNLLNINIGKGVTDIDEAFGCRSLEKVSVDPKNTVYHSDGNCLIETHTKTLIIGTKYSTIPDDGSVTIVGSGAFSGYEIPSIKLPEGIVEIQGFAFTRIVEIELPSTINKIHDMAFLSCYELERVLYNGTVYERNKIEGLDSPQNENLLAAEWQYGSEWTNSDIEFNVKDVVVMEFRDSGDRGDDDLEYEHYYFYPKVEIKFEDGRTVSANSGSHEISNLENELGKKIHFYDNQSFARQWGYGEHTVLAYFMGVTTEFTVTVLENPIKNIKVEPIDLIENFDGYMDGHYDQELGEFVYNSWFRYNAVPKKLAVNFKDGSIISGTWNEVVEQIENYEIKQRLETQSGAISGYDSDQSFEDQWAPGEHRGYLYLLGVRGDYTVNVIGIESIEVDDISILENTHGLQENEYYYYNDFVPSFKVKLTNGEILSSENGQVKITDNYFSLHYNSNVQHENHWLAGNTYEIPYSLLGYSGTFNVTIEPKQVEHIEMFSLPYKTQYVIGNENFAAKGGKIRVYYNNGTDEIIDLENSMVSGFTNTTAGAKTLTVTYGGKTASFNVKVKKHTQDHTYAECFVGCEEEFFGSWQISPSQTGVYSIKPTSWQGGFSDHYIAIFDQNGDAIKYNESKQGWPLVKGQNYTISVRCYAPENSFNTNWTLEKITDTIFTDVPSSEWYNDAIIYSVGRGIISGYGGTTNFGPGDNIQRQDFMVILARLDGVDLAKYGNKTSAFSDVPEGSYFEAAVNWGAENGIVNGYANGKFGTGDKITREQLVKFLYNYANYKSIDTSYKASTKISTKRDFDDYNQISDWALDSVLWAKENNIIKGKEERKIVPAGNALRCEVAQIMYNIFKNNIF